MDEKFKRAVLLDTVRTFFQGFPGMEDLLADWFRRERTDILQELAGKMAEDAAIEKDRRKKKIADDFARIIRDEIIDHGGTEEVSVLVTDRREVMTVSEGAGSNLLKEDIADGYSDYADITTYRFYGGELSEYDGGQLLLKKDFRTEYPSGNRKKLIEDAMETMYGHVYPYMVLR